jgi:hypothetical protein
MPPVSSAALVQAADSGRPMTTVAAAGGAGATVLQALRLACDRGWFAPQVVGVEAEVRRVACDCGVALGGFALVDAAETAGAAVALVRSGQARLVMKGQIAVRHPAVDVTEAVYVTGQTCGSARDDTRTGRSA